MTNIFVYPYHRASMSAKALAKALDCLMIRRENSQFKGNAQRAVINWGCRSLPEEVMRCRVLNDPSAVAVAANKLRFFKRMKRRGHSSIIPEFTDDKEVAKQWVANGCTVFCRTQLSGHSGRDIVIAENGDVGQVVDAPLYTKYVQKKDEYRVYVVGGVAIDVARKARRLDHDDPNWRIRSWWNGFVFARKNCNPHRHVYDVALAAVEACGLDFAAVDVIWNAAQRKAYVLEVNTAPGIEGRTIDVYAKALTALASGGEIGSANADAAA